MYGNPSQVASQLKQAFYKMEQKLSEQMIYGRRVARN
jgi:predicted metalloenzyme YecM